MSRHNFEDVVNLLRNFLEELKTEKLNKNLTSIREKLYNYFKDDSYKNLIDYSNGYGNDDHYSDELDKDIDDYAKPGEADGFDEEFNKDDESVENLDSHAAYKGCKWDFLLYWTPPPLQTTQNIFNTNLLLQGAMCAIRDLT